MDRNLNVGGQIQWISSLRGLLVFLVFFSHLAIPIASKDFLFVIGRIGVVGFFMISGYLAVTSVERRNLKQFYFNRFLRIYPMFWLLLTMTFFLSDKWSIGDLLWNMTLFEEFVGCDKMIGSSWMLPIMVIFFLLLPYVQRSKKRIELAWWTVCVGCVLIAILRYMTGKPFPTALCLLMNVGLLGFMDKTKSGKDILCKVCIYEVLLIVCAYLSYGDRVVAYFIAYNLGFATYYLFKHKNLHAKVFDILGEQGFTFFLGAAIPIVALTKAIPSIANLEWYYYAALQFALTFMFSYVLTQWCEKPLLTWGKKMERLLE